MPKLIITLTYFDIRTHFLILIQSWFFLITVSNETFARVEEDPYEKP